MAQTQRPRIGADTYIASTAYVAGDVQLGDRCTVMHHVVIRGDVSPIRIGNRVNIQDGSIVHTPRGTPLDIGDDVAVGHRAVVHCRRVGRRTLIGIGAIVLDGCEIGERCLIAAGSVLVPTTLVPDGSVVMGAPGRVVRPIGPAELELIDHVVASYLELGPLHAAGHFPNLVTCPPNTIPDGA